MSSTVYDDPAKGQRPDESSRSGGPADALIGLLAELLVEFPEHLDEELLDEFIQELQQPGDAREAAVKLIAKLLRGVR